MKVLLTGAAGQLGRSLIAQQPAGIELIATSRQDLDLASADACRAAVRHHQPDWVLNAGAYTAVDKAESEAELAHAVNAGAPAAFASALHDQGGRLRGVSRGHGLCRGVRGSDAVPPRLHCAKQPDGDLRALPRW